MEFCLFLFFTTLSFVSVSVLHPGRLHFSFDSQFLVCIVTVKTDVRAKRNSRVKLAMLQTLRKVNKEACIWA